MKIYLAIYRETGQVEYWPKVAPSDQTHINLGYLDHDKLYVTREQQSWIHRLIDFITRR